jgi:hypothetical protein
MDRWGETLVGILTSNEQNTREWLQERIDHTITDLHEIEQQLSEIRPVHVDMSEQVANAIIAKVRSGMVIPQDVVDAVKEQAGAYGWSYITPPMGANGPAVRIRANADGTISLEILDMHNSLRWSGELVPPNYGETKEEMPPEEMGMSAAPG